MHIRRSGFNTLLCTLLCATLPALAQNGAGAVHSGGIENTASGASSTIGGGIINKSTGPYATISGGDGNISSSTATTVGGGSSNTASSRQATVSGGYRNVASGRQATVIGGMDNEAIGLGSVVAGGEGNTARGYYSFVAGKGANDGGYSRTFVWDDNSGDDATAENSFNVNASGGIFLNGSVHASSDRNKKTNFSPVSSEDVLNKVLQIPITTWRFKTEDHSILHIGPVAQDFMATFGYGIDEKHITSTDADGVALAAIQGLNQKLENKQAEIDSLTQQLKAFEQRLQTLERQTK